MQYLCNASMHVYFCNVIASNAIIASERESGGVSE